MAEEAEWLDAEAAAEYVRLPVNTIYRMVRDGRLAALRFPVRIERRHLDSLLERCRIKPGELAHLNRSGDPLRDTSRRRGTPAARPASSFSTACPDPPG